MDKRGSGEKGGRLKEPLLPSSDNASAVTEGIAWQAGVYQM
jgi:hypothetical protein